MAEAKERIAARREMLDRVFPNNSEQLNDWTSLVNGLPFQFLKVDGTEVWALDPESFSEQLPSAIRWFDSNAPEDFRRLQAIAEMAYDPATKTIKVDESVKHCLHGYEWVRPVTWDDHAPAETEVVHQPSFQENEANWRKTVAMITETIGFSEQTCHSPGCNAKALNGRDCCPDHEFVSDKQCKWAGCQKHALKNSAFCPGHSQ